MRKLSLFVLITLLANFVNAQCGSFNWAKFENDDLSKIQSFERDERKNDSLRIGNSIYFVSMKEVNKMGANSIDELFINKFNYQSLESEARKAFIKSETGAVNEAIGINYEKESFEGSFVLSDRIVVITTLKTKNLKEVYCLARIISPALEIEKYVVFDTLKSHQQITILPWGSGLLFTYFSLEDRLRYKPTTFFFQAYDFDMKPISDLISYPPEATQSMLRLEGIIGFEPEGMVIAKTWVKSGEAIVKFDLKNKAIEFYNLDIKERLSDLKYKFNKNGDLICAGFYLVNGSVKNLPDVQGIYLSTFKRGTVENLSSCKIPIKPESFDKYCASSVNMSKTYLRYFMLVDICFDPDGNTVIAGERIDDQYMNNNYSKNEIVVYTINSSCEIINEHHIPKMLAETYRITASCNMFNYRGTVYITFRDNPQNIDVYDKDKIQKLLEKSRGMLVLAKLENSGKYVKKCLISQEENLNDNVKYFPNAQNTSEDMLFEKNLFTGGKYVKIFGRYLIDKD
jgi:hypothetical protein